MCSGYLIIMHYAERVIGKNESFSDFMKKRIISIYPIYFITEIVSIVIYVYRNGIYAITFQDILFDMLLIKTGWIYDDATYNAVGWFVCVLMICYIAFYCSCIFSAKWENSVKTLTYIMLSLVFVGLAIQNHPLGIPFLFGHNGTGLSNFFVGGLTALLFWEKRKDRRISIVATIILCLFLLTWVFFDIFLNYPDWLGRSHIVYTLFLCPLIFLSLDVGVVKIIGEVCYPLGIISKYVCFLHMPIYLVLRTILPSNYILGPIKTYIIYWALLIVIAVICFSCSKLIVRIKRLRKEI